MFVWAIEGEIEDPDAFMGQLRRWSGPVLAEAGAPPRGHVGGVTFEDEAYLAAWFDSAPEGEAFLGADPHAEWLRGLATLFRGEPTETRTDDVQHVQPPDPEHTTEVGLVQVNRAVVPDRARLEEAAATTDAAMDTYRDDILGHARFWHDRTVMTQLVYYVAGVAVFDVLVEPPGGAVVSIPDDVVAAYHQVISSYEDLWVLNLEAPDLIVG